MREMVKIDLPWIEQIPKEWSTKRMKEFLSERKETCLADDGYRLLAVSEYYGVAPKKDVIKEGEQETRAESVEGYKICHPGDLAMNIMLAWRRAMGVSDYLGIISPSYAVFQPKNGIQVNMKFFHYLFRTDVYAKYFEGNSTGIMASRWRLYPDVFLSLRCQFPPIDEQYRIATYLDERCGKIDEAIAKHKALIEKLDEYRKAVITKSVTKGVRESGLDDWQEKAIKFSFRIVPGATPSSGTPEYWDGDIVWITPSDYKTNEHFVSKGAKTITNEGYHSCSTRLVPVGSLIFSKRAPIGTVAISKVELCTNQGCLSCVPKRDVNVEFFYYSFIANLEKFEVLGSGTTFKEISTSVFANVKIATPSIEEQSEIVAYLDKKCAAIDSAKNSHQQLITKLEEYKKSLIYNAVTGKIEC